MRFLIIDINIFFKTSNSNSITSRVYLNSIINYINSEDKALLHLKNGIVKL